MSENSLLTIFAKNVKERRKALSFTQAELASLVGVTPSFITEIETGRRSPSFSTIEAMAKALEISAWRLFCKAEEMSQNSNEDAKKALLKEKIILLLDNEL